MVKKYIEELKELSDYFGSDEFNKIIRIIKQHDGIDQERLKYNLDAIEGLPENKFRKVLESIFYNLEAKYDKVGSFPKSYIDYEGVRFYLMIGQGSAYWTARIEDN